MALPLLSVILRPWIGTVPTLRHVSVQIQRPIISNTLRNWIIRFKHERSVTERSSRPVPIYYILRPVLAFEFDEILLLRQENEQRQLCAVGEYILSRRRGGRWRPGGGLSLRGRRPAEEGRDEVDD